MDLIEAMQKRHSVRRYNGIPLSDEHAALLCEQIDECNRQSGLHVQLVRNEPKAFGGGVLHYGMILGAKDYIALVGKRDDAEMLYKCGEIGERLVLFATTLGLGTCFAALTYKKVRGAISVAGDERLALVIAVGYGKNNGVPHKSKPIEKLSNVTGDSPMWFRRGVEAAMLAPTAINQQSFFIELVGDSGVKITSSTLICREIDLGIVRYHFELGAGKENFYWV